MAEPAGPFHLLQAGPGRYLCYCRPGPGPGGTVYVTDALEVWAGELGVRPPLGCRCRPEEHGTKLREALGRQAASLSLGEGKATLQPRDEAQCSALDLFKLPVAEARSQLQALVFGMAEHVESLERRLEVVETLASSCSPEKNAAWSQQLFVPGGCWSCVHVLSRTLLSPLSCGCCQPPHSSGALPSTEGARAQRGGSRGVWDALCSGHMPGIIRLGCWRLTLGLQDCQSN
ncbi:protein PAXX isoform 2-T2 [Morphnus guianensis]